VSGVEGRSSSEGEYRFVVEQLQRQLDGIMTQQHGMSDALRHLMEENLSLRRAAMAAEEMAAAPARAAVAAQAATAPPVPPQHQVVSDALTGPSVSRLVSQLQLPGFDRGKDVDTWLFKVERYLELCSPAPTEAQKVGFASLKLEGQAATWWRNLYASHNVPGDWAAFKAQFKAQFQNLPPQEAARDKLARARQISTVSDYVDYTRALHCQIIDLAEAEKMDRFKRGLKPGLQEKVRTARPAPASFEEMTVLALTLDAAERAARAGTVKLQGNSGHGGANWNTQHAREREAPMELDSAHVGVVKGSRNVSGSTAAVGGMYRPPHKRQTDMGKVRCYNCDCFGHYAAQCTKPKRSRAPKQGGWYRGHRQ
jgi:hypothetical protein